ncbi:unnamed protein product [Effrenium voratum]|uniref:Uncharacterized protein n=1 Tax=Effrenium voratum TaxID=2562239 RepID=A0AA36JF80_9DINO|nr:unnamed protein product [Effrenium voratum]
MPDGEAELRLDWVDSSMYDQGYVDAIRDEDQAEATAEEAATDAEASKLVPLNACVDAFAEAEEMKVENGNGVKCDKCKVAVDAQKKIASWQKSC